MEDGLCNHEVLNMAMTEKSPQLDAPDALGDGIGIALPVGTVIERGFDFDAVRQEHRPTISIVFPPTSEENDPIWKSRDELAQRLEGVRSACVPLGNKPIEENSPVLPAYKPWPEQWMGRPEAEGAIGETDLYLSARARLAAKLLVFDSAQSLRMFLARVFPRKKDENKDAVGAVKSSFAAVLPEHDDVYFIADAKYFCLICLCREQLVVEVICHEAVHAGMAYARRVKRSPWEAARGHEEEAVAYPAGRIAAEIYRYLKEREYFDALAPAGGA